VKSNNNYAGAHDCALFLAGLITLYLLPMMIITKLFSVLYFNNQNSH